MRLYDVFVIVNAHMCSRVAG